MNINSKKQLFVPIFLRSGTAVLFFHGRVFLDIEFFGYKNFRITTGENHIYVVKKKKKSFNLMTEKDDRREGRKKRRVEGGGGGRDGGRGISFR